MKIVSLILSLLVGAIGVYMILNNEWPTPPFLSGIAFVLIGAGISSNCCSCMCACKCKK